MTYLNCDELLVYERRKTYIEQSKNTFFVNIVDLIDKTKEDVRMRTWKKGLCLTLAVLLVSQSFTGDRLLSVKAEETQNTEEGKEEVKEEVLEIASLAEFKAFAEKVNKGETFEGKTVRLVNDIAFDGVTVNNFEPIGNYDYSFQGTFDGAGHSISGIIMTGTDGSLFESINNASISNLILENCEFNTTFASGIAYYARNSQIYNCNLKNCIIKGKVCAAGMFVSASDTDLVCCNSTSTVSAPYESGRAAGLVLFANNCNILNCSNNGSVKAHSVVAGLVGFADSCIFKNDMNKGNVTSVELQLDETKEYYFCVAGLVGALHGGSISNCGNQADVRGQYSDMNSYYVYDYSQELDVFSEEHDPDWSKNENDDDDYERNEDYDYDDYQFGGDSLHKGTSLNKKVKLQNMMQLSDDIVNEDTSQSKDITENAETQKNYLVNTGGLVGEIYKKSQDKISELYIQNCYHTGKVTLAERQSDNKTVQQSNKELIGVIGSVNELAQKITSWYRDKDDKIQGTIVSDEMDSMDVVLSNCFFPTVEGLETETGVYTGVCTSRNMIAKDVEQMQTVSFLNLLNHNRGVNKDWTRWKLTDSYPAHEDAYPVFTNGKLQGVYEPDAEVTFTVTPLDDETEMVAPTVNDGKVSMISNGNNSYSFLVPKERVDIAYTGKGIEFFAELPVLPDATEAPTPTPVITLPPQSTNTPVPTETVTLSPVPSSTAGTPVPNDTNAPLVTPQPTPVMEPVNNSLILYAGGNTGNTKTYKIKVSNISNYSISYESSNTSVATVAKDGKITAKKAGTAVIYAHVKDTASGVSYPFVLANLTVKKAGISFSKKVTTLKVKKSATFKVKKSGITGTVKWSVSNKNLASITSKGVLKAKKAGKVKVTATCGKQKIVATVTIKK